ncbi:MAG TPA: hypothetical protein VF604_11035 [Pyrinomonadaceae bacterium]|jgi:fatty acid desaturase
MENKQPQVTFFHKFLAIFILSIILVLLIFLGWLVYYGISRLALSELASLLTVMIPAVVAIITVTGTIFAAIKTKSAERVKEIEQELRKQKAPIYEEFSNFLLDKVLNNKASEDEMKEFVINFHQKMLVWGGDNVIKA